MELLVKVVGLVQLLEMFFVVLLARISFLVSLVVIQRSMNIHSCMFQVSLSLFRKLLTMLQDFLKYVLDPSPPPIKLKVKLQEKAKKHQGDISGVYTLQLKFVNGYPTWKQKSSKNSIWYDTLTSKWIIGWTSDLGTKRGGILGPKHEDDWPQNLSDWQYDNGRDVDYWVDAGSDVVIEDYSDGKLNAFQPCLKSYQTLYLFSVSDKDCTIS